MSSQDGFHEPLNSLNVTNTSLPRFIPSCLRPLLRLWTEITQYMGRFTNPLLLAILYAALIIPAGLLLRLSGKDPLGRKKRPTLASYWKIRQASAPTPEEMRYPF